MNNENIVYYVLQSMMCVCVLKLWAAVNEYDKLINFWLPGGGEGQACATYIGPLITPINVPFTVKSGINNLGHYV